MRATEFITEGKKNRRDKKHTIKPRGPDTHAEPNKANESKDVRELKVDSSKPRNFVAKNAKMGGAGAHKDKKKAMKQGDVKHKGKVDEENDKQFAQRMKKQAEQPPTKGMSQKDKVDKGWAHPDTLKKKGVAEAGATFRAGNARRAAINAMTPEERKAYDEKRAEQQRKRDEARLEKERQKNAEKKGVAEGGFGRDAYQRDYDSSVSGFGRRNRADDWDEGNTEPPNNFAVYINGKKWKVFAGRGTYADDAREMAQYRQLQDWARKKSESTGKKWEVSRTGEAPTA